MAHFRRTALTFVVLLAASRSAAPQAELPPRPAAILDNNDTMVLLVRPAYVELQQALASPLTDRQEWAVAYQRAARLAEIENLLFFRNDASAGKPEWTAAVVRARQASADVAARALIGLRTVKTENVDAIRATFGAVSEGCNACHHAFARDAPVIRP